MSLKSEKLAQRLQEIQKFLAERITQDITYIAIAEELVKIADSLREGKLSIQIVSKYPIPAQALQKFLSSSDIAEGYQFKIVSLPSKSQLASESPATLIRNISSNQTGQKQTRYKLSTTQNTIIGRAPQCQISIDDSLTLVSGCHAELQPIPIANSNSNNLRWQICDRSRYGTYINGQRLQGCQILKTGDRITLTAPSVSASSPEFIFEYQINSTPNETKDYKQLTNCDVLCLVTNATQPLSAEEKQAIAEVSRTQLSKLFLVIDIPAPDSQTLQVSKTNLLVIKEWLAQNANSLKLTPLLLQPFYSNMQGITVPDIFQQEFDNFAQSLKALLKQPEDILLNRVTTQLTFQLNRIECIFDAQEEALKKEIRQDEEKLQKVGREDLKEQAKKAIKKASDERDKFFKQIKFEIAQSKAALIDAFSKKSISYKIQQFSDALKPIVVKHGGDKYIQIKPGNTLNISDTNSSLTYLCYSTLSHWASKESEKIYTSYAEGGLNGVFQRTYTTLNFISSLNLLKSSFQVISKFDIQRNFQNSTVQAPDEVYYQSISPVGYIAKQLRTQTMQWMFLIGIIPVGLALFGLQSSQNGGKNKFIQNMLSPIIAALTDRPLLLAVVLTLILFIVFTSLAYAFQKENKVKIEDEAEKLKKNMCSHYQSLAKSLVEKTVQDFSMELDEQEQTLKQAIETVGEQFTAYIAEVEKSQLLIKSGIEKRKAQQKNLEKEKADLQKLKRF